MAEEPMVLEEEEVDVLSLVANQGEGGDIEEDDDHGDLPDSVEELKALLEKEREVKSKRNKSLKKSKQAIHRTMEENESLRKRLDEIEKRIGESKAANGAEDIEKKSREWAEKVVDDPSQAIAYADWKQSLLEDKLARFLDDTIKGLRSEIAQLKGASSPDMAKYREKISALRESNDELAELDDATLMKVVKVLDGTKVRTPRGSIGGKRPAGGGDDFKLTDDIRQAMGF